MIVKPVGDKIAYAKAKLESTQNDYNNCKKYFKEKGMPDDRSDEDAYCGYFKEMTDYWTNLISRLEEQNQ